ncbi:nucleoside recognition domain-containing protein [Capnocytophaga sp. ARDL2]|uniref:nucleoside recognition domain-containing protein n=1 Tax=Capnocytophaga sp. ARDL2 TaxID=3238809 RepID=UPI003558D18A
MALSRIWSAFIIVAISIAFGKHLFSDSYKDIYNDMIVGNSGDTVWLQTYPKSDFFELHQDKINDSKEILYKEKQENITLYRIQKADGIITTSKIAINICLGLIGIMTLFMGFMSIAEKAGGIRLLSRWIHPFFSKLFPEVPKNHPAFGQMMLNFSANLLGLDNAATPFGLRAMESLQEINPDKDKASNSQIMFLCLHASGLTIIPVSIIAIRASMGAESPTDVFLPCMLSTFMSTLAALILVAVKQKINLLQPVLFLFLGGISFVIATFVYFLVQLDKMELDSFSKILSNGLILFIFLAIVLGGVYKKINVFDAFIEGAKDGFSVCVKIMPYLVGILISISLLRTSGVFDLILDGIRWGVSYTSLDPRFVDGLPTALIKPLSGSGARGMMVDAMNTFGVDSFQAKLTGIVQGSTDTTFYVLAVYFGAVGIRNTRYALGVMLFSDLIGFIASFTLAYIFFI